MRSRAASARRIRSTARSRSSSGGPPVARLGERNAGMSASARPRVRRICATRLGIPSSASPPDAPTDLGMIQRRCGTSVMTSKYPAWLCALALVAVACVPQTIAPSPSPTAAATASASPSPSPGLAAPVAASTVTMRHRWQLVPDGFVSSAPEPSPYQVLVGFVGDPRPGRPTARIQPGGREAPLAGPINPNFFGVILDLNGLAPGGYSVEIVEHLTGGAEAIVGRTSFMLSQPEYVVWTLDFEGDASGDAELVNTAAIADGLKIPMSVFWNPRGWTTTQVSSERQDAMVAWTKGRQAKGDEVALHLHMWIDYVLAAGVGHVAPGARTAPSWAGRGDGYDVPITAYTEAEQRTLIDYGVKVMAQPGL